MAGDNRADDARTNTPEGASPSLQKLWNDVSSEIGGALDKASRSLRGQGEDLKTQVEEIDLERKRRDAQKSIEQGANEVRRELGKAQKDLSKSLQGFTNDVRRFGDSLTNELAQMMKVSPRDLEESFSKNLRKLDVDKNGFVSKAELESSSGDFFFKLQNGRVLAVLSKHFDTIQSLNDDEFGFENDGITLKDVQKISEYKTAGSGFGAASLTALDSAFSSTSLTASGVGGVAGGMGLRTVLKAGAGKSVIGGIAIAGATLFGSALLGAGDYLSNKDRINALLSDLK